MENKTEEIDGKCLDATIYGVCYCPSHRNNRHVGDDGRLMVRHENGWREANPGERQFFDRFAEARH